MAVLYRKYRPQTFADVLGQRPIIQTLQNQVKSGTVAHAYLFTGSRGVGKTSVARILAKAVNCLNPKDGEACGVCQVCKAVAENSFLDLVEVDAASNTGVDNIRELIEHVRFSPSVGKYKVFIIDEVHMLSKGAFNALLKTLEEPPKHAIFILATTEINKLPATVISRTQRFDFKAQSQADLLELLQKVVAAENLEINKEVLELVAQNAQGSARDALSLFEKLLSLGGSPGLDESRSLLGLTDMAVCQNLLELIASGRAAELPEFFSDLSEKGADSLAFNRDFLEFLRQVLVAKISPGSQRNIGNHNEPEALAGRFSLNELIFIIRLFLKSYKDLPSAPDPVIPLLLAGIEAALKKSDSLRAAEPLPAKTVPAEIGRQNFSAAQPQIQIKKNDGGEVQTEPGSTLTSEQEYALETMALEELNALWPKVIEKIRQVNGPLASLLRSAKLEGVESGKVVLGVKFLFNKQSLESPKNFTLLVDNLLAVTGKRMSVMARVISETKPEAAGAAETLAEALKVFGGELIE